MLLNGHLGEWFPIGSGVRQGDSLSPTLFACFINDLAVQINELNVGIPIEDKKLNILLYADDIVLISPDHASAQLQLNVLSDWCVKWGMYINVGKSQVLHVRHHQQRRDPRPLSCMGQELEYVSSYKYLGYYMHEHFNQTKTIYVLTGSARRDFVRLISTFNKFRNMGHRTYESLYTSNILSIANYASGVWGFKEFQNARVLQNKVGRFYLGTHTFTPLAAVGLELDWLDIKYTRWLEMLRLKNRIVEMEDHRWPKAIWGWDLKTDNESWASEIKFILNYVGLTEESELHGVTDLEFVRNKLLDINRNKWRMEALGKEKLCTFNLINDFDNPKTLVKANLDRWERSLITKLKAGVLPLHLETGRYKGVKRELRYCKVCKKEKVEDEIHFLFICEPLEYVRDCFIKQMEKDKHGFKEMSNMDKLKYFVSEECLRKFAKWLVKMYARRREILYR